MSGRFIDAIRSDPISILAEEPTFPLSSVKSYLDGVIKLSKENGFKASDIDEITVDGLDANQVWWQAKIILDSVEGDLLAKVQEHLDVGSESSDDTDHSDIDRKSSASSAEEEVSNASDEIDDEIENDSDELLPGDIAESEDDQAAEAKDDDKLSTEGDVSASPEAYDEQDQDQRIDGKENSELNDDFFNLEEFNRQTVGMEDKSENEADDEDIDYFNEVPSDDDEEAIYYEDFFDKPGAKDSRASSNTIRNTQNSNENLLEEDYDTAVNSAKLDLFADEPEPSESDNEQDSSKKSMSTYERQQIDIQRQIEQLEQEAIADKKWALMGEVDAQNRPADSLLTEDVEFDRTAKPVPVVTTDVTESIEQLIRRRIQEYNFDDLQKRVISDMSSQRMKPQFELSDQKSSKSLAEIYEDDYKNVPQDAGVSEELKKSHDEISNLFSSLCYKLDALSSAHFIPKPAQKSLEVRVDTAAISMEDAQPLSMSSASTLAPQEIYKVAKSSDPNEITLRNGIAMSKDELTRDDKNRLRRAAKRKKSKSATRNVRKKSKKDDVIDSLASGKNITVINKKGEKHDIRGRAKNGNNSGSGVDNIKL